LKIFYFSKASVSCLILGFCRYWPVVVSATAANEITMLFAEEVK
jgi:hypothetical protein